MDFDNIWTADPEKDWNRPFQQRWSLAQIDNHLDTYDYLIGYCLLVSQELTTLLVLGLRPGTGVRRCATA